MPTEKADGVRTADRLVEALRTQGVDRVFGVPGAKIDALYDALVDSGIVTVVCRHEQNAAFIAGAHGRLTGNPGVVAVTSGPGTANLATGLLTANTEQDPVVALCGAVPRTDRLKRTHQTMDAAALLRTVTKYTAEVTDPDNVVEAVANAFRAATTEPKGAAAVVLPADVLADLTTSQLTRRTWAPETGPAPGFAIARAAELIRGARRPVLMVGMRAADPESVHAVRELIRTTRLPVVETFQAAGTVPLDLEDRYAGRVGLFRNQPGDILVSHADLLVTIGYDAVEYDPRLWNSDPRRTVVHIDAVAANIDNHYLPEVELRGSVAATVTALTAQLPDVKVDAAWADELAEARRGLAAIDDAARDAEHGPAGLDPARLVLLLRDLLPEDTTVACDIGSVYIYVARHLRVHEPRRLLFSNGQQTLGVGLPWAMASALVRPETPTVSISGDGGFLFSAPELETAHRLGLEFVHIIFRDNTYDMVGFQELLKYGRKSGVQLGDYDTEALAGAFGARGYRPASEDEFIAAVREALAAGGRSLIDVPVDYSHNTALGSVLPAEVFE
ncbi:acetolactate synthase [Paractinoplanes deccanensis]|uniref:Acetolactate synthase n=1 Tax=Paractinoplanes deccanensis TaxID=113561 RepID=A0ABQ3XV44_9ACTN|nr:acetolactate synthase AlsS [Actinoplanes deccanensis]GID71603.1 acetolactate synthase [Actinoplanes deccanensis]